MTKEMLEKKAKETGNPYFFAYAWGIYTKESLKAEKQSIARIDIHLDNRIKPENQHTIDNINEVLNFLGE